MGEIGWRQAELATGEWLRAAGFDDVVVTAASGDGGVDAQGKGVIAQVKTRPVSVADLQELMGVAGTHGDATPCMFTSEVLEEDAVDWARGHSRLEIYQLRDDGEVIAVSSSAAARLAKLARAAAAASRFGERARDDGIEGLVGGAQNLDTPDVLVRVDLSGRAVGVGALRGWRGDAGTRRLIVFAVGSFTLPARQEFAESATLADYAVAKGTVRYGLPPRAPLGRWDDYAGGQTAAQQRATYDSGGVATRGDAVHQGVAPQDEPVPAVSSDTDRQSPPWVWVALIAAVVMVGGLIAVASLQGGGEPDNSEFVDRDCSDFSFQQDAQVVYEGAGDGDPHRLDDDGDGIVCELLPDDPDRPSMR